MRRPLLLALMSTAILAAASAMLAFGGALAVPFAALVSRDVLIQLGVPFTLLVLVAGAVIIERFGLRMRLERSPSIAATHLAIACFFFGAYACFPLLYWPAFAENRFDLGFDLRSGGRWVIAAWLVYLLITFAVAILISRLPKAPSRAPRFALVAIAVVTCIATLFAARRIGAQPRGYLANLSPVHLDADGPARTQVGSLCIWRGVERGISVAQLARGASCPDEPMPAATRRDPGTTLLFDAKRDVFYEPSKYHGGDSGYLSQLSSVEHDIVTLRDVGAPPPRVLFYCAIAALLLAALLEMERSRGRDLRPSSVAIVAAFAAPLVVATIIGT